MWCFNCELDLPKSEFEGSNSNCRNCQTWLKQIAQRRGWLRSKYGLTLEQHKQIHADQGRRCALCNRPTPYDKIHTDHNHVTGKIRGLLCCRCDHGLGCLGDNIGGLQKAIEYLKKSQI